MLDGVHKMILQSVTRGDDDNESPALENLLAAGLAERHAGGVRVTPAGEAALRAGKKTRVELWALRAAAGAGIVLAVMQVIEWLS